MTSNDGTSNTRYNPFAMDDLPPLEGENRFRRLLRRTLKEYPSLRMVKRIIVSVIGGTILLFGVALLVLPGPAFVVIPTGLAVLALEFRWARRWLRKAKSLIAKNESDDDSEDETSDKRTN